MESIRKICCAFQRDGKSIRQIARDFHLSRNTVKKVLRDEFNELIYTRSAQPLPKLGPYETSLLERLRVDADKPRRSRSARGGHVGGHNSAMRPAPSMSSAKRNDAG